MDRFSRSDTSMSMLKTGILLAALTALFMGVGYLIGGPGGMALAFLFAAGTNLFAYWNSDKMVLKMYRAQEVTPESAPKFYNLVSELAQNAELPMPKVYIINDPTPNAFATGRNPEHAAVAATTGILQGLNNDELAGVLSHELAHVKHRDILTGTIAATMVGTITFIAQMAGWAMLFYGRGSSRDNDGLAGLVLIILSPIAATLLQLAISRSREFAADEGGAKISGKPLALASALEKISAASSMKQLDNVGPATAHMFIVNPLRSGGVMKLFSTHPSMEERVKRLQKIAQTM